MSTVCLILSLYGTKISENWQKKCEKVVSLVLEKNCSNSENVTKASFGMRTVLCPSQDLTGRCKNKKNCQKGKSFRGFC